MTARCCPTCGQELPTGLVPVEALAEAVLTTQQEKIVAELIRAYPRSVRTNLLIDALWGADPNGGPEKARYVVHVQISHIRKAIGHHGWTISKQIAGAGNKNGRYRLERLP